MTFCIFAFCFAIPFMTAVTDDLTLSPAYLVNNSRVLFPTTINWRNATSFVVNFNDPDYEQKTTNIGADRLPVVVGADPAMIPFDLKTYFSELKTKELGRTLIIGDIIPTTMNLAKDFAGVPGLLVIAIEQTAGRGRGSTKWTSPRGDLMITVNVKVDAQNEAKSTLLQSVGALAMVSAVNQFEGYSSLRVKYSWPNAVEWVDIEKMIGGVLVERNREQQEWYAVGCGLRVNSELPFSIEAMVEEHNLRNPSKELQLPSLAKLIAHTMNRMEKYLKMMARDPIEFKRETEKFRKNKREPVSVRIEGTVDSINERGFLVVKDGKGSKVEPHWL